METMQIPIRERGVGVSSHVGQALESLGPRRERSWYMEDNVLINHGL